MHSVKMSVHAVRACESIPVQKWNSQQVGQVHYQMTGGGF